MADEAQIRSSMEIKKGKIDYRSLPSAFLANVTGTKGPTPGAVTVTVFGTAIDLSELTTPGLCRIMNIDATNYVEYGIRDPETETFYPFGEILPGESYILRLSRNLAFEYYGTGTGTGTGTGPDTGDVGAETNVLWFRANTASVNVVVEAFEV